jgi:serine/threonine protein kinase
MTNAKSITELRQYGIAGSYRYMAPEVFENTPSYDEKVDIYSSAMIMWYIAMDQRPFDRVPADLVARQACKTGLRPSLDGVKNRLYRTIPL